MYHIGNKIPGETVNCISPNGGVLKNEGGGVKLSKVRAYGCRAVMNFGSLTENGLKVYE